MTISSLVLAAGIAWSGVSPETHIGGRVASPGYLQGKVILVDCRDYSEPSDDLARLEEFWQSYKCKQFIVLGAHRGGDVERAKANVAKAGVTYPVYDGAAFESPTFEPANGLVYVIHAAGHMATKTRDMNRAYESAVTCMTWAAVPATIQRYNRLIDYNLEVLPGKAYNYIKAMQKEFPKEAKRDYADAFKKLDADAEVKKAAKLEEIAAQVKDFNPKSKRNGRRVSVNPKKVETLIKAASALKESENPLIVQEVKNCIADLKWAMAEKETK